MSQRNSPFLCLPVDIQHLILSNLSPKDVLLCRLICKGLEGLTKERSIWIAQCRGHITSKGHPFPTYTPLNAMSLSELEHHAVNCFRVAQKWLCFAHGRSEKFPDGDFATCETVTIKEVCEGVGIYATHYLNIHGRLLLLILYKAIWSVLDLWDVADPVNPTKICEWTTKGSIIKALVVNKDQSSEATIALGVYTEAKEHVVQILTVPPSLNLEILLSIPSIFVPLTLKGHLVALCQGTQSRTMIWNWKSSRYAMLDEELPEEGAISTRSEDASEDILGARPEYPLEVTFAQGGVLIGRAKFVTLHRTPELLYSSFEEAETAPTGYLAKHTFGYLDSICTTADEPHDADTPPSYRILTRGYTDDPWRERDEHSLHVYRLDFNLDFLEHPSTTVPYLFPPVHEARIPTRRGKLHCPEIFLSKKGVALWVQPKKWEGPYPGYAPVPLINVASSDPDEPGRISWVRMGDWEREKEYIRAAILPGSVYRRADDGSKGTALLGEGTDGEVNVRPVLLKTNRCLEADWTSMDWDEETGRIVLGHQDGRVMLIEM
ncbi:hypothetical protein DFP72DRAFT_906586 [Ephemerocybe angulata]|uniref:F-box domain-containing protein n=1 Tax=Ephemerocybe angulata TaxID=980116 RepID=A0A8H6M3L8_9AGAR|nr:hypothetical protein DFP72DRAFT_906586 [Tulosesus angulatus]